MQRVAASGLMRILALGVFVIGVDPSMAINSSEVPVDIFGRFGLLGVWSPNCSAPASHTNPRVIWGASNGKVMHSVSFDGRTVELLDTVASATILNDHDLGLTHTGRRSYPATVIVRLVEDRIWTIYSAAADGHVFYDQGIEVATGKPSLVDERCEALTS